MSTISTGTPEVQNIVSSGTPEIGAPGTGMSSLPVLIESTSRLTRKRNRDSSITREPSITRDSSTSCDSCEQHSPKRMLSYYVTPLSPERVSDSPLFQVSEWPRVYVQPLTPDLYNRYNCHMYGCPQSPECDKCVRVKAILRLGNQTLISDEPGALVSANVDDEGQSCTLFPRLNSLPDKICDSDTQN